MKRAAPTTHPLEWSNVPVWSVLKRKKEVGRPELPLLSVYRDHGVILKDSRDDNYNRPGQDLSAYQVVRQGDVVANKMKTWQGSIAVSTLQGLVSPAYIVCEVGSRFHHKFLHYLLRSLPYVTEYRRLSYGVRPAQWDLRWDDLRDVRLLQPPLDTQRAIADFLDRETERIDGLVEKKRRLIELLEEKRTALITHAVTKGLDPSAPMKDSGIPWLGRIPQHWEARPLKALVSKIGSGKTPRGGATVYVDSGVTFIRSQNVHFGGLRLDDVVYISADIDAEMAGTRVRHGDVLLNITGASLGRCCSVVSPDLRANVNQHVSILRPLSTIDSGWLAYALESHPLQEQIWATQGGAAREGLNSTASGQLRLPVGTSDEQEQIASYLEKRTTLIAAAVEKILNQLDRLAEYRQALITGAVTGQIDVTAGAREPEEVVA